MITLLQDDKIDLVMMFHNEPDEEGHFSGVNLTSPTNLTKVLEHVNEIFGITFCFAISFLELYYYFHFGVDIVISNSYNFHTYFIQFL